MFNVGDIVCEKRSVGNNTPNWEEVQKYKVSRIFAGNYYQIAGLPSKHNLAPYDQLIDGHDIANELEYKQWLLHHEHQRTLNILKSKY